MSRAPTLQQKVIEGEPKGDRNGTEVGPKLPPNGGCHGRGLAVKIPLFCRISFRKSSFGPLWVAFRSHFGFFSVPFRSHFGSISVPFRSHFGPTSVPNPIDAEMLKISKKIDVFTSLGPIWVPFGSHFGPTSVPLRSHFGPNFGPNFGPTSVPFGVLHSVSVPLCFFSGSVSVPIWVPLRSHL